MRDLEHSVYGLDYHQRSSTIAVAAGTKLYSVALGSVRQTLQNKRTRIVIQDTHPFLAIRITFEPNELNIIVL